MVYLGAVHNRFEHSLGVIHVATIQEGENKEFPTIYWEISART